MVTSVGARTRREGSGGSDLGLHPLWRSTRPSSPGSAPPTHFPATSSRGTDFFGFRWPSTVMTEVMKHLGIKSTSEQMAPLELFRCKLAEHHRPGVHRLALARAADRIRWHVKFPPKGLVAGTGSADAEQNLANAVAQLATFADARILYREADALVQSALCGSIDEMLRLLPGKKIIGFAAQALGIAPKTYTRLVRDGLRGELGKEMGDGLARALGPYLPART